MFRLTCFSAVILTLGLAGPPVRAQEGPEPEVLPPPQRVEEPVPFRIYLQPYPHAPLPPGLAPTFPPRPETRDVWRYYAPDRNLEWRPRVILAPYGSYYYYNGQPYPWTTNRSYNYLPVIRGSPY